MDGSLGTWEFAGDGVLRWLRGTRNRPTLLPGRPLDAALPGPPQRPDQPDRPDIVVERRVRAVCCSGGGIRAAAFAIGGMQALGRRSVGPSWYEEVDLVTAVSGGSYMAGSFAMVDHHLTPEQRREALPYAPGSPEDNRLRAHTRYLVEDPRVAAIGLLNVLYGLLLNLVPVLALIFIGAKLLGGLLNRTGVLAREDGNWTVHNVGPAAAFVLAVAGVGLALFAAERLHDVYRSPWLPFTDFTRAWSLRLLSAALLLAFGLLAVPVLLHELSTSRVNLDPRGLSVGAQFGGFLATTSAIVGLVRTSVGRFKATLQTTVGRTGTVTGLLGRGLRWLSPWAGSAVAVGLLLAAFMSWTTSAAYDGLQGSEWSRLLLAAGVMLVWQACTDVNRNSVHPFYKERLSSAFAVQRVDATTARELPYSQAVSLSGFAPDNAGASGVRRPQLVVCAAVNTDEEGRVPAGRGCAPFTFSSTLVGVSSGTMFDGEAAALERIRRAGASAAGTGAEAHEDDVRPRRRPRGPLMRPTADYEAAAGKRLVTLPAAIAVSGAAVSPAMGRMTRAPLRLLLGLANVRLGLWLPNPRDRRLPCAPSGRPRSLGDVAGQVAWQLRQPGVRSLLREILGRTSLRGRWIYVTDGGHYENLGLVEALRRGATEIIAFDASGDEPYKWTAFGEAVETARTDLGVRIALDPRTMKPADDSGRAPTLAVQGTCHYPDGQQATLVLCKLALPENMPESWDIAAWSSGHPSFPHDTTAQQLYGDREFEAYRRLGELAGHVALTLLQDQQKPSPGGANHGAASNGSVDVRATLADAVAPARSGSHNDDVS